MNNFGEKVNFNRYFYKYQPLRPLLEAKLHEAIRLAREQIAAREVPRLEGGIDKLREYRTALISAAVTGKIDVREAV